METLLLRIEHKEVEPTPEPAPTGEVWIERDAQQALLLTPDVIDPAYRYPLVTVLHGAGRQDRLLGRAYREEPERRQALFLVPRSLDETWDLIAGAGRPDLDFLEHAYDLIYRRYPVAAGRQAVIGYSDGASYALSMGLSNPRIFSAVLGWAAAFVLIDPEGLDGDPPRPRVLLEHGTHDPVFPFEAVALPLRRRLESLGYGVELRIDQNGRHRPSSEFQSEALDWLFEHKGEVPWTT